MINFEPTDAFLRSISDYMSGNCITFNAIELSIKGATFYKDNIALGTIVPSNRQPDFAAGEILMLELTEGIMKILV